MFDLRLKDVIAAKLDVIRLLTMLKKVDQECHLSCWSTSLGQFLLPVQLRWTINSITGTALNSWLHPKVCMFNARHVDSKAAVFTEQNQSCTEIGTPGKLAASPLMGGTLAANCLAGYLPIAGARLLKCHGCIHMPVGLNTLALGVLLLRDLL